MEDRLTDSVCSNVGVKVKVRLGPNVCLYDMGQNRKNK